MSTNIVDTLNGDNTADTTEAAVMALPIAIVTVRYKQFINYKDPHSAYIWVTKKAVIPTFEKETELILKNIEDGYQPFSNYKGVNNPTIDALNWAKYLLTHTIGGEKDTLIANITKFKEFCRNIMPPCTDMNRDMCCGNTLTNNDQAKKLRRMIS